MPRQFLGMSTKPFPARSPGAKVGGLAYFGRMLDKARAHQRGELPEEYVPNLGKGFDGRCIRFLHLDYDDFARRANEGGSDEEVLQWAYQTGRQPAEEEIEVWNEFMRKCGWNDDISPTLERRKKQSGFEDRQEITTMFQYIDADEGRPVSGS